MPTRPKSPSKSSTPSRRKVRNQTTQKKKKVRRTRSTGSLKRARTPKGEPGLWGSIVEGTSLLLPSFLMVMVAGGLLSGTLKSTLQSARTHAPESAPSPGVSGASGPTPLSSRQPPQQPIVSAARHRDQTALEQRFAELSGAPLHERVKSWGYWLKENYAGFRSGWMGLERPGRDQVAWFPQELDCTTFVETVLALAESPSLGVVPLRLRQIRYRSQSVASVESRNHFPEIDWTPNLVRLGWVTDVTAHVGGPSGLTQVTKQIEREKFVARLEGRKPASVEAQTASVEMIPAEALPARLSDLPRVGIINWVRKGVDQRPSVVSHQGILLQNGGEAWMIHVPVHEHGRIHSLPVRRYLSQHPDLLGAQVLQLHDAIQVDSLSGKY